MIIIINRFDDGIQNGHVGVWWKLSLTLITQSILLLMNMKLILSELLPPPPSSSFFSFLFFFIRMSFQCSDIIRHRESLTWILNTWGIHRNATIIMSWIHLHFEKGIIFLVPPTSRSGMSPILYIQSYFFSSILLRM